MPFLKYKVPTATAIALMLLLGPIDRLAGQPAAAQPQVAEDPTIGGKVQDEKQSPIVGVKVALIWTEAAKPGDLAPGIQRKHEFAAITDAHGRWTYGGVPMSAIGHLRIILQSGDFAPLPVEAIDVGALEKQAVAWTMSRGVDVAGHVVDTDGKPVSNARLYGGPSLPVSLKVNPAAITDVAGAFLLHHMPGGPKAVIWTAAAGFAPIAEVYDLTIHRDAFSITLFP
jgi:hypothetical protein